MQPPEAVGFFNFKALKWLKIGTKHLKNAKINNANLYYNFPPGFLKTFLQQGGPVPPLAPPIESPMRSRHARMQEGKLSYSISLVVPIVKYMGFF